MIKMGVKIVPDDPASLKQAKKDLQTYLEIVEQMEQSLEVVEDEPQPDIWENLEHGPALERFVARVYTTYSGNIKDIFDMLFAQARVTAEEFTERFGGKQWRSLSGTIGRAAANARLPLPYEVLEEIRGGSIVREYALLQQFRTAIENYKAGLVRIA